MIDWTKRHAWVAALAGIAIFAALGGCEQHPWERTKALYEHESHDDHGSDDKAEGDHSKEKDDHHAKEDDHKGEEKEHAGEEKSGEKPQKKEVEKSEARKVF